MTTRLRMLFLEAVARAASAEHTKKHPELAMRANGQDPYCPEDVENVIRGLLEVLTGTGQVREVEYSVN